jgi:hypothetical protein
MKTAKKKIFAYRKDGAIIIFKVAPSSNDKITSSKTPIVQQYSFSKGQFEQAEKKDQKQPLKAFFSADKDVCFDCPFSSGNGGGCYTHKFHSFLSFLNVLNDVKKNYPTFEQLPELPELPESGIINDVKDKYMRFGVYGESIILPVVWVEALTKNAKNWTGYTHQWKTDLAQPYLSYFMASTNNISETFLASAMGWRCFQATKTAPEKGNGIINCPASKESGYKTTCEDCGLCNGRKENDKRKNIFIIEH